MPALAGVSSGGGVRVRGAAAARAGGDGAARGLGWSATNCALVMPKVIVSPSSSCWRSTSRSLTKVPLVDPRSMTKNTPSSHQIFACVEDAPAAPVLMLQLDPDKDARLTQVNVDLDVDLFGQCALTFNDPKLALINGQDFKAGAQIKVELGYGARLGKVFEGEVVALEPQFRRDLPPSLRVVCQESIHRLALKTATRALMEVDGKEIASKIAQEHGLTAEAPSGTKEHVLQANVSDSTLLRRVAATSGHHLRIEGKKLVIGPPPKGEEITVVPGQGLKKMRVRIKAAGQIGEVPIHRWEPKEKRQIVGKAKPEGA